MSKTALPMSATKYPTQYARWKRLKEAGVCIVCGKRKPSRGRMCSPCADAHQAIVRRRREEAIAAGICVHCFHAPVKEGRRWCAACAEKTIARNAAAAERKVKAGICANCKQPRVTARYCRLHAGLHCVAKMTRQKRLRAEGRCERCGVVTDGRRLCDKHNRLANERALASISRVIAEGRCQMCRQPRGKNGTTRYCRPCADKHARVELDRQWRMATEGTCCTCRNPTLSGSRRCDACRTKANEAARRRYYNHKREGT